MTIPEKENLIIQKDKEIILSHHTKKHQNIKQHFKRVTPKHQTLIRQVQSTEEIQTDPPGIENTENLELRLNRINCKSTNEESETENTLSIDMLHIVNK